MKYMYAGGVEVRQDELASLVDAAQTLQVLGLGTDMDLDQEMPPPLSPLVEVEGSLAIPSTSPAIRDSIPRALPTK